MQRPAVRRTRREHPGVLAGAVVAELPLRPAFLQADTYRYSGHHVGDINREYYRSKQEEQHWKSDRDPIKLHSKWLLDRAYTDAASLERITSEVRSEMESAVKFAIAAPYPSVEEVEKHVYA